METRVVVENKFDVSDEKLWKAITNGEEMKLWYFDLEKFVPEAGFEFRFWGGTKENKYLHVCIITEVIPNRKICYSWRYDGIAGITHVCFEIERNTAGGSTLKLTHTGFETFPKDNKDLNIENFQKGWNFILGTSLKNYLEQ